MDPRSEDRPDGQGGARVALRREGRVAVLVLDSAPVNALGARLRADLRARLREIEADPAIDAAVLTGAGRLFCGGADITEFDANPDAVDLGALVDRVEASGKPIVAAIHGAALGGGLELAMACHLRVATPSARLGLPEVKLGLVPGAGGTQRLPRLVGVDHALDMITGGAPVGAREALDRGLIDAIAPEDEAVAQAVALARSLGAEGPPRRTRDRAERLEEGRDGDRFTAFRGAQAKRLRGVAAPEAGIACVEAACRLPFEAGLAFEADAFRRLLVGAQSVALRHAFFAEREVARIPDLPADTPTRPIKRVGIVGAGLMGGGIAMTFLDAGFPVTLVEVAPEALTRGLATVRANYAASVRKGRIGEGAVEERLDRLQATLDFDTLGACDLVIEAVFEEMAVKRTVFARLDAVARPGAILASNTSFLDLDAIAAFTGRPQDVVGLHFFSPAHIMRLLEVVRGAHTAPDVVATAMRLGRTLGKIAVQVGVCRGFVGNRLLDERQREADRLVLDGVLPWEVDRVLEAFGLPMGPFAMSDLIGIDLGWTRAASRGETIREILCERDRRGQKTGRGFYDYDAKRRASPSQETVAIIRQVAERRGIAPRAIDEAEILERCLYPMVNAGARLLEEGKAWRASDIDVVWIAGFGWPAHTGGPMHWADTVGLPTILERLRAHEARFGADFTPAPLLERLAAEGTGFGAFDRARRPARS